MADDWIRFQFLGTTCHLNPAGLEFAHIGARMTVFNHGWGSHWASNMRISARLVSPNNGLHIANSWHTTRYPVFSELLQDHSYVHDLWVNTDVESPADDWDVQLKLIWDRKFPWTDVVHQYQYHFSGCSSSDGSGTLTTGVGTEPLLPAR